MLLLLLPLAPPVPLALPLLVLLLPPPLPALLPAGDAKIQTQFHNPFAGAATEPAPGPPALPPPQLLLPLAPPCAAAALGCAAAAAAVAAATSCCSWVTCIWVSRYRVSKN